MEKCFLIRKRGACRGARSGFCLSLARCTYTLQLVVLPTEKNKSVREVRNRGESIHVASKGSGEMYSSDPLGMSIMVGDRVGSPSQGAKPRKREREGENEMGKMNRPKLKKKNGRKRKTQVELAETRSRQTMERGELEKRWGNAMQQKQTLRENERLARRELMRARNTTTVGEMLILFSINCRKEPIKCGKKIIKYPAQCQLCASCPSKAGVLFLVP